MLNKGNIKSTWFKHLSTSAASVLTEINSIYFSFSNRLTNITTLALAACATTISNQNKWQQLATNQLQLIATDISNLRAQLIAFCQGSIKQIASIKPKELQQHKLAKGIASNLQQNLNKELVVAADVICQLSERYTKQQKNMQQQQKTSLLNLLSLQDELTKELARLKTSLKQQVAAAILKILQTKNNFEKRLTMQPTFVLASNIIIELQQQLQKIMIQVLQNSQQIIIKAERWLDLEPFKITVQQPNTIKAQPKIYNIKQQNLHNAEAVKANKIVNSKTFLAT